MKHKINIVAYKVEFDDNFYEPYLYFGVPKDGCLGDVTHTEALVSALDLVKALNEIEQLNTELNVEREEVASLESDIESIGDCLHKELEELKYINERLQKHCSELTEQLNMCLGKCASLEKANAAYRALEKKRDEVSECLPVVRYQGACHD